MDSTTTTTSSTTGKSYQWKTGNDILYPNKEPVFKQYGWVCPLCGRANAPWISQCPCMPTTVWSGPIWSSTEWTSTPDHTTITN